MGQSVAISRASRTCGGAVLPICVTRIRSTGHVHSFRKLGVDRQVREEAPAPHRTVDTSTPARLEKRRSAGVEAGDVGGVDERGPAAADPPGVGRVVALARIGHGQGAE